MKKLADNFCVFGEHDEGTISQMWTCLNTGGKKAVLCADGHKGYAQPVGGVIAYQNLISISGVGFDIGCGNLAVQTNLKAEDLDVPRIMDEIAKKISFGVGRSNPEKVDHALFDDEAWKIDLIKDLKQMAREQLGTCGSGNHYVDIFRDEKGLVWIGAHFGSRGFGHKTALAFLKKMGGKDGMDVAPTLIDYNSSLGQAYMAAMQLAGDYATAGREYVVAYILKKILCTKSTQIIHNHHNFAWVEKHNGEDLIVVRKGATPAFPGQKGFIGGSMGDDAVIIEGVDSEESREALYSTVHGAGRVMSRSQAKGKFVKNEGGKKIRQNGLVRHDDMMKWIKEKGVELRGADVDEAPQAYRRLSEVLDYHKNTIKILHTLTPMGVCMAGANVVDPYRD